MQWNEFIYRGDVYNLSHLNPFEWYFEQPKTDKTQARRYRFNVLFSMHCFTKGGTLSQDKFLLYKGPKETRTFCFERYQHSKQLPEIIKGLGNRVCWHTHHGSFFTIEIQDIEGKTREYEVYFEVFKSAKGWMTLYVKSAYMRDPEYQTMQPRKRRIRFSVIAKNRFEGKKLHPPR